MSNTSSRLAKLISCLGLLALEPACTSSLAPLGANVLVSSSTTSSPVVPIIMATPSVRLYGRFDNSDSAGPRFSWSGSSVLATFKGTAVSAQINAIGVYFTVFVDGVQSSRFLATGENTYSLASGLSNETHTVLLMRDTEGYEGVAQFLGFEFGSGALQAPAAFASDVRMEVIGDSITCGLGSLGVCAEGFANDSGTASYAQQTPILLGAAPATVVCYSGKGMVRNYGSALGSTDPAMPFEYLYTLTPNGSTPISGLWVPPTVETIQPNVVVINLGTNDFCDQSVPSTYVSSYVSFVQSMRSNYPSADIFLTIGPMTVLPGVQIQEVVSQLKSAGDQKVHYVEFPLQTLPSGCNGHPSAATHAQMAKQLAAAIKSVRGD